MKKTIPYFVIGVLVALLFIQHQKNGKEEKIVERVVVDTVTIVEIDTIFDSRTIFSKERIVDTIYMEKPGSGLVSLPISSRFYSGENYNLWISGFQPKLDSISIFQKTKTNVVKEHVTKEVYLEKGELFFNAGGYIMAGEKFMPNVGVSYKFKNGFTLGGDLGYYNGSAVYGIRLGIKIK